MHIGLMQPKYFTEHTPGPDPEILSISCIHGFMPADVEAMGSHILVVTNDAPAKGAALAESLELHCVKSTCHLGTVAHHKR